MSDSGTQSRFSGRTAWARSLQGPLRDFLATEIGSAVVLLAAAIAALAWANIDLHSYESLWHTDLSIQVGSSGISQDLRDWVNNGLMTFFFFVVGLEVRREFDVGELRERRRLALPVLAALGGMIVPIAIYLAFNAGESSAQGWGVAMSTDTAFALGMLALVGPRFPDRLRGFLLTIIVVDDVIALLVIIAAYSGTIDVVPLLIAVGIFIVIFARPRGREGPRRAGLLPPRARGLGGALRVRRRPGRAGARGRASSPGPTPPAAASSSGRASCSATSASSRPPNSSARRGRGCAKRSRRTRACSSSTTRGRAT